MKKEVMLISIIFLVLMISSCSKIFKRVDVIKNETINTSIENNTAKIEEVINDTKEETLGPGGCRNHQECQQYCQQNQLECQNWCNENPELCNKMLGEEGQGQFPSKFPSGEFPSGFPQGIGVEEMTKMMTTVGPGGCRGPNCQQYCRQNFQECQDWCLENPDEAFCDLFFGFGERIGETIGDVAEPPKTIITYAKSFNFNAGHFTKDDILEAKNLGANMVTFWPIRMVRNDEISTFTMADLPQMIGFAHKNGLQVELRSSIISPDIAKDYEKYKINAIEHAAEYAKLAEKYKVYRIVPFAEVDNDLMNHCNKITEFSQAVLAEMRKHYSGKIGTGVAAPWRDCSFTFKGYDYLSVSAYPHNDLATSINWAREVAEKSGIKILHIGETGVFNPEDPSTPDMFQTTILDKAGEAEYYRDFFTKFSDKIDGISIFYNSGKVPMSINSDPAEEVVKGWYSKIEG